MSNLFKKLFNKITTPETPISREEREARGNYMPDVKLPLDDRFAKNFLINGGKFIYCITMNEIQESFDNILMENDWYEHEVYCLDQHLSQRFNGYNLKFGKDKESSFFFSTCENLIADDGSLLICSNQIKEKKLKELPQNFVVFATTSQFVNNIGEGLKGIKIKNMGRIPTNITTIKNFRAKEEAKDFMSYGSSAKNLYLLLLEDL